MKNLKIDAKRLFAIVLACLFAISMILPLHVNASGELQTPVISLVRNYDAGIKINWESVDEAKGYYLYRSEDGDSFTQIATTKNLSYTSVSAASFTGWKRNETNNTWQYLVKDTVKTGWLHLNDKWYYLDLKTGIMKTGWQLIDENWYYFNPGGTMKTGWFKDNNNWYYLKSSGKMATGWQKIDGKWYYMKSSGAMATGWVKVSGKWYYLKQWGAMATGWIQDNGKWYYLKSSGAMATGWIKVNSKWYYLNSSGAMATGYLEENGKLYYLNSSGALDNSKTETAYRSYSDSTCQINIYKRWYANSWTYCAHVKIKDYKRFFTEGANGAYNNGTESVSHAANRLGAILCINGDYARNNSGNGTPEFAFAIRNGVIQHWRGYTGAQIYANPSLVMGCGSTMSYSSANGLLFGPSAILPNGKSCGNTSLYDAVTNKYVTDSFNFGPTGLNDGIVSGTNTGNKRPRTLIGTNGKAGDLWLIVAAGDGYQSSAGLTGYEGVKELQELGCTFGGHIDGGGSSAMWFRGELLVSSGRDYIADFVLVK